MFFLLTIGLLFLCRNTEFDYIMTEVLYVILCCGFHHLILHGAVFGTQAREKQRKLSTTATTARKTSQELFESSAINALILIFASSASLLVWRLPLTSPIIPIVLL